MSYTANNIYPLLAARMAHEQNNSDGSRMTELDLNQFKENFAALPADESANSKEFLKNAAHQIEDMLLR